MNRILKLSEKTIGIAGVGGLGSNVAALLTRMQIGKLILVDFDIVEDINLNRQNFFIEHIGKSKVYACKDVLERFNRGTTIEIYNTKLDEGNIKNIFSDADIIVEAFDDAKEKAMIVNYVLLNMKSKYIVGASGIGGYKSNNLIKTKRVLEKFYLIGDFESNGEIEMYGPRVNIVAAMQANVVVRILMGELNE
jgi:sulfur carrier protein ThiS adenylyltransferase